MEPYISGSRFPLMNLIPSLIALIVSVILLARFGAYEIEYGSGTVVVDGGWFLIISNHIRVGVLTLLCVLSGIKVFKKSK